MAMANPTERRPLSDQLPRLRSNSPLRGGNSPKSQGPPKIRQEQFARRNLPRARLEGNAYSACTRVSTQVHQGNIQVYPGVPRHGQDNEVWYPGATRVYPGMVNISRFGTRGAS